jgi:hypothetical protein
MELTAFATLTVPFIVIVYLAFLMFIHPTRPILLASLLAGLIMGLINMAFDLLAYYAHWWHYTLNGLMLHLPIPFYITPILVYGSIAFLLIWRFWHGRYHWLSLLLLIAIPLFRAATDILGAAVTHSGYIQYDSLLAGPMNVVMWLVMFYASFFIFNHFVHLNLALRKQLS